MALGPTSLSSYGLYIELLWVPLCHRNGIEGLNDDLLARGFAMNEEGGILKVLSSSCCVMNVTNNGYNHC